MRSLLVSTAAFTIAASASWGVVTTTAAPAVVRPPVETTAVRAADPSPVVGSAAEANEPAGAGDDAEIATPPAVRLHPRVLVVGADLEDERWVADALGRFRGAGLRLPDMEIRFFDDRSACRGHEGLFQPQHTPWRVLVCSELQFVVTHEFAHAWEAATLTDAGRSAYADHRGLATWSAADVEWGERAVEDAAFVVQQNLMAGNVDTDAERWIELTGAYEALTGAASPLVRPSEPTFWG